MDIQKFREDLLARMRDTGKSQSSLSSIYGVQQASLSRFLSGSKGLNGDAVLRLWPFVYGASPTAPSTTPPIPAPAQSQTANI